MRAGAGRRFGAGGRGRHTFGDRAVCDAGPGLDMMTALYRGNGEQGEVPCLSLNVDRVAPFTVTATLNSPMMRPSAPSKVQFCAGTQADVIREVVSPDYEKQLSKLVFVLDFSTSMELPFSGGGPRIDALKSAVALRSAGRKIAVWRCSICPSSPGSVSNNFVEGNGPVVANTIQGTPVARGADAGTNYRLGFVEQLKFCSGTT